MDNRLPLWVEGRQREKQAYITRIGLAIKGMGIEDLKKLLRFIENMKED